jgi:hypothetical protein
MEKLNIHEFDFLSMPTSCTWIIIGPPTTGKCLGKDTKVVMHDLSLKVVQEIEVGDKLMGDDKEPRNVISITEGRDMLYRVTHNEGSFVCNGEHILCLAPRRGSIVEIKLIDLLLVKARKKELWTCLFKSYPHHTFERQKGREIEVEDLECCRVSPLTEKQIEEKMKDLGFLSGHKFLNHWDFPLQINSKTEEEENNIISLARSIGLEYRLEKDCVLLGQSPCFVPLGHPLIEPIGRGSYYGFEITRNGRFLLEGNVVTHNTTMIENMMYYTRNKYPVGRFITGSDSTYQRWKEIVPPLFVSGSYKPELHKSIIERQRSMIRTYGKEDESVPAVVVFDDIGDDPKVFKNRYFLASVKNGSQHHQDLVVVGNQYAIDFPTTYRGAISYVALFKQDNEIDRKKLYNNFGGILGDFKRFCQVLDTITGDYTCLIIDNRSQNKDKKERVFYYRTKKIDDDWKFGCSDYRKWSRKRYDKNCKDEIDLD